MALQVWLPLNGDLKNWGLSNVQATNVNATVDNSGKIGKCYAFNGSTSRIAVSGLSLGNIWSCGCWVKNSGGSDWSAIMTLNTNGGDGDLQFGIYY